jgi:hypothetical protein
MTTTADSPETAIRRAAWAEAVDLYHRYRDAEGRSSGGPGGRGFRDPYAAESLPILRRVLDGLVATHGFQGTYVDRMAPWNVHSSATQSGYPFCDECEQQP